MKQSKDPFEAAFEEQEESPPDSPIGAEENETQNEAAITVNDHGTDEFVSINHPENPSTYVAATVPTGTAGKPKEDDEEEEEEHMEVQLGKLASSSDPDKTAKMQTILSQFTEEQMSRYESFRRSGFQKSNMKRLLVSITGSQKISVPMTIVMSGIAKMFVGELIETDVSSWQLGFEYLRSESPLVMWTVGVKMEAFPDEDISASDFTNNHIGQDTFKKHIMVPCAVAF
nr:transcription initiation factor TFIID subunit 11 [Ipomoea batatas]